MHWEICLGTLLPCSAVYLSFENSISHNWCSVYYLDQSIEYVEETRCPLSWHALLHSLMFINIHKLFGDVRGVWIFQGTSSSSIQVKNDYSSNCFIDLHYLIEVGRLTNGLPVRHDAPGLVDWICSQEMWDKILGLLKSAKLLMKSLAWILALLPLPLMWYLTVSAAWLQAL